MTVTDHAYRRSEVPRLLSADGAATWNDAVRGG